MGPFYNSSRTSTQKPCIQFLVVFQQILMLVKPSDFEVIRWRPFRLVSLQRLKQRTRLPFSEKSFHFPLATLQLSRLCVKPPPSSDQRNSQASSIAQTPTLPPTPLLPFAAKGSCSNPVHLQPPLRSLSFLLLNVPFP